MAAPRILRVWQASTIFDSFQWFFSKDSAEYSATGNLIDFFPSFDVLFGPEVKKKGSHKMLKKNETKAAITPA